MKQETDPIEEDEWLLRRVRLERFIPNGVCLISPNAFEPRCKGRDVDTDGISLFREACLIAVDDILANLPTDKRDENGIVRLQVKDLHAIGLTVLVRVADITGHVVIPELNSEKYQADKARFTPVKKQLAELAAANIVRWPPALQR